MKKRSQSQNRRIAIQNGNKPLLGFCGQGFVGSNMADDFETRGYKVIRYSLDKEYLKNKNKIKTADIVFFAVPTPTTPNGFDDSILEKVLSLVGKGKIAVIKSTIIPGTTEKFQKKFKDIIILHSPEFLTEKTAKYDAKFPDRNIVGYLPSKRGSEASAYKVLDILPNAPYRAVMRAQEAEMVKYGNNCWFYFKVVYMNILYEICQSKKIDFEIVKKAMSFDPRIGHTHLDVVHQGGRGAGGGCLIKDLSAFSILYDEANDVRGKMVLLEIQAKNIQLLIDSGKDIGLLSGVYGDKLIDELKKLK